MNMTKEQLKQIIKEELEQTLSEMEAGFTQWAGQTDEEPQQQQKEYAAAEILVNKWNEIIKSLIKTGKYPKKSGGGGGKLFANTQKAMGPKDLKKMKQLGQYIKDDMKISRGHTTDVNTHGRYQTNLTPWIGYPYVKLAEDPGYIPVGSKRKEPKRPWWKRFLGLK